MIVRPFVVRLQEAYAQVVVAPDKVLM